MYKIAICDDDKRYRKTIREIVEHENSLHENEIRFYEYESGNELLKHTDILHELVFIDIRMPGLDGNQTALKLRNYNKDAVLIFCSSYFEPTVDSINFGQPFRYIMKDLHDTSLRREIAAIMTEVKRRFLNDYAVTVTSAGKIIRIHVENILYVSRAKRGSDPAYIIYTSGTTGKPKGVVISHEAAMNTIYDVIERFSLNRETVILGLSNLAFDLSVFDIFGCFQVGGTLVLPDDELKKNPKHILDLIIINRVTVLNAVPAQMKMLDSYMDNAGILEISWVKLIIMSGDWIPVGLPENLFKKFTNAIVVSMGGATECAIWSIFHIIPRGYEKKNSIPYGKPLSNQKFYILNAGMEDCPDGVSGDIYIAGKGLAKEYFKDKEMTDQKFIFLPRIGERIYKTGDVGQYDEAGIIEFLGRSDNQVKVRGHRIELTEIDSILSENKELDDVVSIIVGDAQEDRRIVTVAVPKQAEVATEDTSQEIANIKNKEEELTKEVNKELLSEWVHAANKVVLSDIFLALYGKGVFTDSNRLYTYEEIVKTLNIPNKLYKLMHRWLTVLCNEKIVVHRDGGYCVNLFIAEQYKNNKKLWDEMYSIEGRLHYSQKLLDYLKTSSDVLPELMAGKEDPLNLLFPKGEMDVANPFGNGWADYLCGQI